eukprot:1794088-Rhodomonas_salina.1
MPDTWILVGCTRIGIPSRVITGMPRRTVLYYLTRSSRYEPTASPASRADSAVADVITIVPGYPGDCCLASERARLKHFFLTHRD